ncbi:MAG: ATP synthase F1 subunit delta, partial [Gemmatimonadetes bacterium]|nr:ATP synthase F1 subunit delta [Gemmatimonadota bacterium]
AGVREDTVVRNYAETLFELAERDGGAAGYGDPVAAVAGLMEDRKVIEFFGTPRVSADTKKEALERALGDSVPPMLLRFLTVVVDRGRQRLIPAIMKDFQALLDRHRGIRHMEVTVARELGAAEAEALAERLSSATGAEVIPTVRVRPEIIGGIVIREGDTLYDGSVKRQLDAMRRALMATELQGQES